TRPFPLGAPAPPSARRLRTPPPAGPEPRGKPPPAVRENPPRLSRPFGHAARRAVSLPGQGHLPVRDGTVSAVQAAAELSRAPVPAITGRAPAVRGGAGHPLEALRRRAL